MLTVAASEPPGEAEAEAVYLFPTTLLLALVRRSPFLLAMVVLAAMPAEMQVLRAVIPGSNGIRPPLYLPKGAEEAHPVVEVRVELQPVE